MPTIQLLRPAITVLRRRDSGDSSAATSASGSGRRQRLQDPWLVDGADGGQQRSHRHLDGRPRRRDSDRQGGTLPVRVPGATAPAAGPPSQDNDTATEYSEYGSVGGIGGIGGGGRSAPTRQEGEDGESDERLTRRPGTAAAAAAATVTATVTRSSARHRDRDRDGGLDRDPGRRTGGGVTGEWEGPPPSGPGGLASSKGSWGSSSLRSSGTRRRVELRTPAEEEAARKASLVCVLVNCYVAASGSYRLRHGSVGLDSASLFMVRVKKLIRFAENGLGLMHGYGLQFRLELSAGILCICARHLNGRPRPIPNSANARSRRSCPRRWPR